MNTFRSKILMVGLAGVCLWLILVVIGAQLRRASQEAELSQAEDRVRAGERENERLTGQLERMKRPAWLSLLARSRLNYKRPDETVVFVYKSEKSDTIAPSQQAPDAAPNWRKWWNWLHRK